MSPNRSLLCLLSINAMMAAALPAAPNYTLFSRGGDNVSALSRLHSYILTL